MDITNFFQKLGLDEKEIRVIMNVIKLGSQPASIIAAHARLDRTTTYRILKNLSQKKLLAESKSRGVTTFYLQKLSDIQHFIERQKSQYDELEHEFKNLSPQISALHSNVQELPRIQIYEGYARLETFYRDIVDRAKEQGLLLIRILGSNTFSQKLERKELGEITEKFEKDLRQSKIEADILIAQGNLTREWISKLNSFHAMSNLPAAGGATNLILVGESVFMVSFRDFPVALRIDHPDIAQTMHFLFDMTRNTHEAKRSAL